MLPDLNIVMDSCRFLFILDSAIEREKGVQVIGVHRKSEKLVVTLLVMRIFSGFLGVSRTCAYLRDSIAESRIIKATAMLQFMACVQREPINKQ